MHSVLDRLKREEVRLHQPHCETLPLTVYEGTYTHSPPCCYASTWIDHCVCVDFFSCNVSQQTHEVGVLVMIGGVKDYGLEAKTWRITIKVVNRLNNYGGGSTAMSWL